MKKFVILYLSLLFLAASSSHNKTDILKEQEAIIAVIEQQKSSYLNRDLEGIAATWMQKPTSVKLHMTQTG